MSELLGRILDDKGIPRLVRKEEDGVQPLLGNIYGEYWPVGDKLSLENLRVLAPILPSKVIGVGSNYKAHIEEMGRPVPPVPKIFLKPNTAVIGNLDAICLPPDCERIDHEAELGVVIGRYAQRVTQEEALQYVLGYTCINDVTARDFQRSDGVFTRGKGFDTFCPVGPWILKSAEDVPRRIQCWVDDELRQDGTTSDLLFAIPRLISFISHVMTLLPGDIITTGTPSGVGPIQDGQTVRIEIEGIGELRNPVVNREDRCSLG